MLLLTDGDLVIGRGAGDVEGFVCPPALDTVPIERLRLVGDEIIDAGGRTEWFVDDMGRRHIEAGPGRQALTAAFDAPLVRESDGNWSTPPTGTLPQLAAALMEAGLAACDAIIMQVIPDATHQQAYDKAAMAVMANGGAPPTADPFKTVFADLGASVGIADPATFAKVVMAVSLASMQLATVLSALKGAAASAKSAKALAAALSTFEATIGAFVEGLNGEGLTAPIAAPAPIVIAGING